MKGSSPLYCYIPPFTSNHAVIKYTNAWYICCLYKTKALRQDVCCCFGGENCFLANLFDKFGECCSSPSPYRSILQVYEQFPRVISTIECTLLANLGLCTRSQFISNNNLMMNSSSSLYCYTAFYIGRQL